MFVQKEPFFLLTSMYFCRGVACKYFGAYDTRSRVVHVVGFFFGGSQICGQRTSPKPLGHRATQQLIGKLTYMYFCRGVACKYFGAYGTRSHVVHVVGFLGDPKFVANVRLNPLSHPPSCILVNHGPSEQSSKEEYKPWK